MSGPSKSGNSKHSVPNRTEDATTNMFDQPQFTIDSSSNTPTAAGSIKKPSKGVSLLVNSGTSSYCHTPTEPYEDSAGILPAPSNVSSAATSSVSDSWEDREIPGDVALDATVASLQAEIGSSAMAPRSVWYLVAHKWFTQWQDSISGLVTTPVGPIDNGPVIDDLGALLPGLKLGVDFDAVPESAWHRMVTLYGVKSSAVLRRIAVKDDSDENSGSGTSVHLDLYPYAVFVRQLADSTGISMRSKKSSSPPKRLLVFSAESLSELKANIATEFYLDSDVYDVDIYMPRNSSNQDHQASSGETITHSKPSADMPPSYEEAVAHADNDKNSDDIHASSASTSITRQFEKMDLDPNVSLKNAGIVPDCIIAFKKVRKTKSQSFESKSGALSQSSKAFCDNDSDDDCKAATDEEMDTNNETVALNDERVGSNSADDNHNASSAPDPSASNMLVISKAHESKRDNERNKADITSSRSSTPQQVKEHYRCGLNNLGNTCFMNSALQCLGHIEELTRYFVSNVYTSELNRENPLGMKGAVASAYGRLVKSMWRIGNGSFAPRLFKQIIGQWAPQFRGYNQQDAPEFLAFLLDGLHEDLNRILKKPYIEVPDANGRPDEEVANEQWDIYKQRNDSVVVDMFQGQYKSTLVCPDCDNISVTFDPFMYLTLPLPVQRQQWIEATFVPMDPKLRATRMHLLVRKEDTIVTLKNLVAHLKQCSSQSLLVCEISMKRIYNIYADGDSLSDISESDTIVVFEIPVDVYTVSADPKSSDFAIVQLMCSKADPKAASSSYSRYSYNNYSPSFISQPLVISLPAKTLTLGDLYLEIAAALARWTTVDMAKLVAQLQKLHNDNNGSIERAANSDDSEDDSSFSSERVLKLLGQAVSLSVHRASTSPAVPRYQRRNLSFLSSYMSMGRNASNTPNVFRSFEDRINKDNCEPLVSTQSPSTNNTHNARVANTALSSPDPSLSGSLSNNRGSDGSTSPIGSSSSDQEMLTPSEGLSRRRSRPMDEDESDVGNGSNAVPGTVWDSSSDNEIASASGAATISSSSKRARSDNGSDNGGSNGGSRAAISGGSSTPSSHFINVKAEPKVAPKASIQTESRSSELDEASTSTGALPPLPLESESANTSVDTADHDSDDDMATATAALSFADMLNSQLTLDTGDTLLCEWDLVATRALLAELHGEESAIMADKLFDFESFDEYSMPLMEDVTRYNDLEPVENRTLDMVRRVQGRPHTQSLSNKHNVTLQQCLNEFTRAEQLGAEDLWYCSKCKEHRQATKKFDIWRVPEVLVVHLKRFQHSRSWRDKLDTFVEFPIDGLDLSHYVAGMHGSDLIYDLHAVCNHYGGLGGGHYTAYALNPEDEKWYDFNDSYVSPLASPDEAKSSAAYMLFYKLRDSSANSASEKIDRLISDFIQNGKSAAHDEDEDDALGRERPDARSSSMAHRPLLYGSDVSMNSPAGLLDDEYASNTGALAEIGPAGFNTSDDDSSDDTISKFSNPASDAADSTDITSSSVTGSGQRLPNSFVDDDDEAML